eukprot:TRINITY_DN39464_c0_g1_i1.p1 TRINITY_DN39464_c0_g1~~TRINITY_DN39464_c0_g1_i1.p1  ORF type:complete len:919 (+),score=206.54 TRINITY_DN39464_c0_g1_i1:143-2899(+)
MSLTTPLLRADSREAIKVGQAKWSFDLTVGNDFVLLPLTTKLCNLCSLVCVLSAIYTHAFYEYAPTRPAVTYAEDPWIHWCMQWTATVASVGWFFEVCLAISIKIMNLEEFYEEDLAFKRRLRLNRKMICVYTVLSTIYHLMAFDYAPVRVGWIAEYYGGHQIVYSGRYLEWVCCAPIVLSCQGQLQDSAQGRPRNALIPSSLLTSVYCLTAWQALIVADFWMAWWLLFISFVAYFLASVEQLAYAKYMWQHEGRAGPIRAALLTYLVVMIGIYGIVYLLPIPGWISATAENKFYCFGDASFKTGTTVMLLVSYDLGNNAEMRRRAEALTEDLQRLIYTASVPIFSVDSSGNISEWNAKMARLTGVVAEVAMGVPVASILTNTLQEDGRDALKLAMKGKDTSYLETSIDTSAFPAEEGSAAARQTAKLILSTAPRRNKYGALAGILFIGYDLTEIAAYKEAEERKRRFLAVVSHELRSPLHGILGLMQFLVEGEADDKKLRFLKMVQNCSTRLLDLVVNIMEMASLANKPGGGNEQKQQKLSHDPVNLKSILDEIVVLIQRSVDKRNKPLVKPEVKLINKAGDLPIIEGDAYKCTQVFYNLITNACKFTDKGEIVVASAADPSGEFVEISISDTGKGIAPQSLQRIFEPFEQEDNSMVRNFEGIGLGLPIANEVVKRHGGYIRVTSKLEVGSTFTVRLPLQMAKTAKKTNDSEPESPVVPVGGKPSDEAQSSEETGNRTSSKESSMCSTGSAYDPQAMSADSLPFMGAPRMDSLPGLHGVQGEAPKKPLILSVDDDPLNQQVLRRNLSSKFEIHEAMDGASALHYLKTCETMPDAMLLDFMMPQMSGMEVAKAIRTELRIPAIVLPILMVSASDKDSTTVDALRSGCNAYIAKPFKRSLILAHLHAVLEMKDTSSAAQ